MRGRVRFLLPVLVLAAACGTGAPAAPDAVDAPEPADSGDVADLPELADLPAAADHAVPADLPDFADLPDLPDGADLPDPDLPDLADPGAADAAPDPGPPPPLWEGLAAQGPALRRIFGVSSHMHQGPGQDAGRDFEFQVYQGLGGARVREDYHWHNIEPADDAFTLEPVATQVAMARDAGVTLLPMLAYGVGWAEHDAGGIDSIDPAEYGEYAGRVAREFCADVKEYELWNEPNLGRFWSPAANPARYGEFVKAAAAAIRAECPDARVVFGGLASYGDGEFFDRWGFLRKALQAHPDLCASFDVLAIHPYTWDQYNSPEQDFVVAFDTAMEGQTGMTDIARRILADAGCPSMPIWFTEMGWPTYLLSEAQVGRFAARSFLLAARDGVEAYFWYTFWDGYPTTEGLRPHEAYFGLFGWTGEDGQTRRAKPSYTALKTILDRFGDARFARDLGPALSLPRDVYALAFVGEGAEADRVVVALWDGREMPDVDPDTTWPGGPGTTHDLVLPLPDGRAVTAAWDVDGQDLPLPPAGPVVSLTLTISPVYLELGSLSL